MLDAPDPGWSAPRDGLRVRLHVQAEDLGAAVRHVVRLEIRNVTGHPVRLSDQPHLDASVTDAAGEPVERFMPPGNAPQRERGWETIAGDSCLALRVDTQGAGMPPRETGEALLALGACCWRLPAGHFVLRTVAHFDKAPGAPAQCWTGDLRPPPVSVVVTPAMFA